VERTFNASLVIFLDEWTTVGCMRVIDATYKSVPQHTYGGAGGEEV
jgi:hypothetical protein